jgi:dihydropteroate synthase
MSSAESVTDSDGIAFPIVARFAALAVMRGAAIVRAHDVAATVDAVKVASALKRAAQEVEEA